MKKRGLLLPALTGILLTFNAAAQLGPGQGEPHIGYIYPAGGQQGTSVKVEIGGQFLKGARDAIISGEGIQARIIEHYKPPSKRQINQMRDKFRMATKEVQEQRKKMIEAGKPLRSLMMNTNLIIQAALKQGLTMEELVELKTLREKMQDKKRQPNAQLEENVKVELTLAQDARPGKREVRLRAANGLTNPLTFYVAPWPERMEKEPNNKFSESNLVYEPPFTANGQIMPGDMDFLRFKARKGQHLVCAVSARELVPYLADAVPGWFQATLALYDEQGKEVAYVDDHRLHPDPLIFCEIQKTGEYTLEIKDAIYRGREDFVYRITVGEIPYVTSIFPLGGPAHKRRNLEVQGFNLPAGTLTMQPHPPGVQLVSIRNSEGSAIELPYAVDSLMERYEREPNDKRHEAQDVKLPLVVNGLMDKPADTDLFKFAARGGTTIVAEILARRLNSPVDSFLKLTDAQGRVLAMNDDYVDLSQGLATHHADSRIMFKLPATGVYYVHVSDIQGKSGKTLSYRLRLAPPEPAFALRVVPASLNIRAASTMPITIQALRRDGFDGPINLELVDAPHGFQLNGGYLQAGQDKLRVTLTAPARPSKDPYELNIQGRAKIDGKEVVRQAVPAEDMMQAFIYRHLVPTEKMLVMITGRPRQQIDLSVKGQTPINLLRGGETLVHIETRNAPNLQDVQLVLNDPPEGIAIEDVMKNNGNLTLHLRVDKEKAAKDAKGNLIVEAFMEQTFQPKNEKAKPVTRRIPLGYLPAIPFVVAR